MKRFKVEIVDPESKWYGQWGIVLDYDEKDDLFYISNGSISEKDDYALPVFKFDQLRFIGKVV